MSEPGTPERMNRCASCGMSVGPSPGWHSDADHNARMRLKARLDVDALIDDYAALLSKYEALTEKAQDVVKANANEIVTARAGGDFGMAQVRVDAAIESLAAALKKEGG